MCRGGCPAEVQCKAAGADKQGVLREGHQARGRSLGLDCRKGRRLAPGVGFEPDAAGRVVSSRRKTSRAVITRTIIDGTTDMRESPDRIVFHAGDGLDRKGHFWGLCRTHRPVASRSRGNNADLSALEI